MIGRKLCFIFLVFSMLTALVVRPVHQDKEVSVKTPKTTLENLTSANAKTNENVVNPLLARKQHCRVVNTHKICRY